MTDTSLSSSTGTKAPTQVEDGNFRLSTRVLEHCPVTSPPTNQNKVTHPAALSPDFDYKNFSLKTILEFRILEHEPPILLARPYHKSFSAPNLNVSVCLASPCVGHRNLCLATLRQLLWSVILYMNSQMTEFSYRTLSSSLFYRDIFSLYTINT